MRPKLLAPLGAFLGGLLFASPGWAPPPFRPPPPPPPPPRLPAPPVRPPGTSYRPPTTVRPPIYVPPNFATSMEAARRRNAIEAAELLRQQSAALSRAQRAVLLNAITHDLLCQQRAATLVELRRLRADWVAVGSGAGLDPIVAMQLEAAESAAERVLLAEVLKLIADGKFDEALAKFEPLELPRYLPVAAIGALPELRDELRRVVPFRQSQAALNQRVAYPVSVWQPLGMLPADRVPKAVSRPARAWFHLAAVQRVLVAGARDPSPLGHIRNVIASTAGVAGAPVARALRAELVAKLFLDGRADDAKQLLEDGIDPIHATALLADLKAAVIGGGAIANPQVAALVPVDQAKPPAPAAVLLTPDRLAKWAPPKRGPGGTTAEAAIASARDELKAALAVEVAVGTANVNAAVGRVRAALAAEAAPRNVFLEKVEAARGKPFATPAERELALVAGARGRTVAEVLGVLATEADRPAAAARLLAAVPAFAPVGEFAVSVELSGRAPEGFAAHAAAAFKLPPGRDRARIREAVSTLLHAQAGKVVADQPVPSLDRASLEVAMRDRLKLPPDQVPTAAECVQGLLDVCRDWADEQARLVEALRDLNQAVADIEAGEYSSADNDLKELTQAVKLRRLAVQTDKKRREVGVAIGCQVLASYGADSSPAGAWLRAQIGNDVPWRTEALGALEQIGTK